MTCSFVRTVRSYEILNSTSDTARELIERGGIELPLLVLAHSQSAGRGRGENRWWSDAGSLTFSLAFDPRSFDLNREQEPRIALATAVAIVRACGSIPTLGIRWPNDIEFQGKKLGGLLPESITTSNGLRFILGIGLNVTTNLSEAPEDVQQMATSLAEIGLHALDKTRVLSAILDRMEETFTQLANNDTLLAQAWNSIDLLRGQQVRLKLGTEIIQGIGAGIGVDGSLRLHTKIGDQVFYAGQVLRDFNATNK